MGAEASSELGNRTKQNALAVVTKAVAGDETEAHGVKGIKLVGDVANGSSEKASQELAKCW